MKIEKYNYEKCVFLLPLYIRKRTHFSENLHERFDKLFRKLVFGVLVVGKCPWRFDWAIKKSKFNFVVEYPTWVSIKRYLTGKLALACQIWIYCIRLKENVKKPPNIAEFWNTPFYMVFGRYLQTGRSKSNSDHLPPTYPSKFVWCSWWVCKQLIRTFSKTASWSNKI